jgi:ABC-type phosphate transport system substrate-binding protein
MQPAPKKFLDQVRDAIRLKHYACSTEQAYVQWIKRFVLFHDKRHPEEMGRTEVEAFLTHLAVKKNVAASTQNQAFSAILFLYRDVLRREIDHEGAIGYVSIGYLGQGVAALAVEGVQPRRETIEDGSYPLTRPFVLVALPSASGEVTAFLQFARSAAGQAVVRRTYGGASSMRR